MELPMEIQQYILDFVRPYLTRPDWKTCRIAESSGLKQLTKVFNYKDQIFYEMLLWGQVANKEERNALFPVKHLRVTFWGFA
jgi:hypothetical protein